MTKDPITRYYAKE